MTIDSLIPAYRAMAGTENFHGLSVLQHADSIGKMVRLVRAKTLLDFGCGRGDAYRSPHHVWKQWDLPFSGVTLYDPAFNRNDQLPAADKKFDVVVCSDVLEHIPEAEVDEFIDRLIGYARHALWASVCCRKAKKKFPDGTNLHVTVKPYDWWHDKFTEAVARARRNVAFTLVETP